MKVEKRGIKYFPDIFVIIILDTGILILLAKEPNFSQEASKCQDWLYKLLSKGFRVVCPEICDYETRRGLLFREKERGITNSKDIQDLDKLKELIEFLPLEEKVLLKAAELWAEARIKGKGNPKGINADILISAHWHVEKEDYPGQNIVIATKNLKDFKIFDRTGYEIECQLWEDINV